jgi:LDH2 family malate/lactate/ureidoglycolate dehydrogenase
MTEPTAARRLRPEALRRDVARVLEAAGADAEAAALVAGSLVGSDVRGVTSHGVIRVPEYLAGIAAGRIDPTARPCRVESLTAVVALDGRGSFGQVAARELALEVADRAGATGLALGTLAGVAHVGRVGEWVELIADAGCLAMAWCNCGDPGGNVLPFGGREARLGTNPMAYAVPVPGRPAVVADFSTSVVAEGRVRVMLHAGRALPEGWVVDARGEPTTDPEALYAGGALQPMAGHKGFALGLLVELLGGVLAGGACASLGERAGNGLVLLAIRPGDPFGERARAVLDAIVATPPAAGTDGVMLPGEPEERAARRSEAEGIACSERTWQAFVQAAASVGVDLES